MKATPEPVHSYWDDFWALKGYDDAVDLARSLEGPRKPDALTGPRTVPRRLLSSIRTAVKAHGIPYLPGSAELGDFDATSTTVALSP